MPDLFSASDRDRRFKDSVAQDNPADEIPKKTPEIKSSPSPVEPFLSEEAHIPDAPTLRKPKHRKMHIFTSYCELPPNVTFENQNDNETILLFLRKSFITNFSWLIGSILLFILPFILLFFVHELFIILPWTFTLILTLSYYLLLFSYAFMNFITWYFDIMLVTDHRIVDIDFEDLVYKNVAETKLDLVQDVSYTQTGTIRTLFDYGDVLIQTAGTIDNFDLKAVPLPERIVNIVEDLIGKGKNVYA